MNLDNDTINAAQQNADEPKTKKSKKHDAMVAKLLASGVVGMGVGVGATYAARQMMNDDEVEAKPAEDETQNQETTTEIAEQATEPAEPTVEERLSTLEEKERIREEHEQQNNKPHTIEPKPEPKSEPEHDEPKQTPEPKPSNDFFKEHDVKIESVEEYTLEDGRTVIIYTGSVDGHYAEFAGDGNGHVVAAIIDGNDDDDIDRSELFDLSSVNINEQQLLALQVPIPTHEVDVISVRHDVEVDGETVDVALVTIDNESVVFIDTNQNGEVDLALADQNNNGELDEGEIQDVSDAHIPMPTEDDITGYVAVNDESIEDYTNDADVEVYDV